MTAEKFTWVKTHKEIVEYLKGKENSQLELIELLKSVGISPFNDKSTIDKHDTELVEIDPFTFFCYIYKYGSKNRLKFLQEIASKLEIEPPTDDSGIPSAQAQKVWLFPYKYERNNNEIERLWNFFKKAYTDKITDEEFEDIIKINSVGKTKITEALFYINPEIFLPINAPVKSYLKNVLNINPDFQNYADYIEILNLIKTKVDIPFYEISYIAREQNDNNRVNNYWIFQGSPDKYDFETAFKNDLIDSWAVTAHKEKIKPGDKAIIWITGKNAGCYALAEVTTEPQVRTEQDIDLQHWKSEVIGEERVGLNITHNLIDNPILKSALEMLPEFEFFKGGNQGTNFTATKEQYELLLDLSGNTYKSFNLILSKMSQEQKDQYFNLLREILNKFEIKINDIRIVFTTSYNGLNFTIGQRYCCSYRSTDPKGIFGVMSSKALNDKSEKFKKNKPIPFYTYYDELNLTDNEKELVFEAVKNELNRTRKTSYRNFNNRFFENYVFEVQNNEPILQMINQYKQHIINGGFADEHYKWQLLGKFRGRPNLNTENFEKEFNEIDYSNLLYHNASSSANQIVKLKSNEYQELLRDLFNESDPLKNRIENFISSVKNLYNDVKSSESHSHNHDERTAATFLTYYNPNKYTFYKSSFYETYCDFLKIDKKNVGEKYVHYLELINELIENYIKTDQVLIDLVKRNLIAEDFQDDHHLLLAQDILYQSFDKKVFNPENNDNGETHETTNNNSFPKNLILYGPPGTGKTYNTKRKAENILGMLPKLNANFMFTTFHQSYAYEQFVEGLAVETDNGNTRYFYKDGCFKIAVIKALNGMKVDEFVEKYPEKEDRKRYFKDKMKPFVLIIDEINRGNISKIFGELITLIEDDKRLGEENEIIVTLPYSGESFGVPPNLYIIGTMNTADRSLVQLDTALRRRFDFEEMMPKYHETDLLKELKENEKLTWNNDGKVNEFDLSLFLYKLNQKIIKEYDREHQIGHSYLMKVKDIKELQRKWENQIMPLLQEYFYDSYDKLSNVIGDKSAYLKKSENNGDNWELNMRVKEEEFPNEFKEVYDFVKKPEDEKNNSN